MRDYKATPRRSGAGRAVFLLPLLVMPGLIAGNNAHGQTLAAAMPSAQQPAPPVTPAGEAAAEQATSGVGSTVDATVKRTRFVIGLDKKVGFSVFALSKPNRVIVELGNTRLDLPSMVGEGPIGLIKSFRGGISAPGRQRVIIEVTAPVVVEQQHLAKSADGSGYQLTLDIAPVSAALNQGRTAALDVAPSKLVFSHRCRAPQKLPAPARRVPTNRSLSSMQDMAAMIQAPPSSAPLRKMSCWRFRRFSGTSCRPLGAIRS